MRHPTAYLLTFFCMALAPCSAQNPPGFDDALARYKECRVRLPFRYQTDGRDRLAQTRCEVALALLTDDYGKTKSYPEYARYTLATLFGRHFDRKEFVDALVLARSSNQRPVDTWLWVKTLRIQADRVGDTDVIAIARESKNMLQRAAAITAIGDSRGGNLKAVVVPNCVDFPKKESDRMLLLGAMSGAFYENRSRVNDSEYRDALTVYIGLLGDDVGLSHTAKVQIARHLQWILKGPAMFVNPEPWLELMKRGDVKAPVVTHTVVAPRFFGVETDGERLCYVIDMSDSMCIDIAPSSKPSTAVVTGPRVKKKRELMDETDLPWEKIKTRWDLAREQLRISLLRMTPDKYFSIVWFGTESGTLDSCKGMVKATKANIDKVVAELDSIKADYKLNPEEQAVSPDGRLRGKTNLHSGLRRAYGLAGRGFVEQVGYVDSEALTEGCDTIFLLSDGAPSWDDFNIVDKDYGEGQVVVDTEYNKPAARSPQLHYHGPYDQDDWLLEDLKRMNAFRRIRVHCIGLGEANMGLLGRIAEVGRGEVFVFGAKKDAPKDGAGGGAKK